MQKKTYDQCLFLVKENKQHPKSAGKMHMFTSK
jgi:hypothetical protein